MTYNTGSFSRPLALCGKLICASVCSWETIKRRNGGRRGEKGRLIAFILYSHWAAVMAIMAQAINPRRSAPWSDQGVSGEMEGRAQAVLAVLL